MEFSIHHPSPPNTYSYVQEENLGSTRKFVQNFLFVYMYFQPNSCNTHAEHDAECEWVQETFLRQWRKVPPAHASRGDYSFTITIPINKHSLCVGWRNLYLDCTINLSSRMSHNKIILVIDVTTLLPLWSCCINHNISATQTRVLVCHTIK
jgi:hypothetical protein